MLIYCQSFADSEVGKSTIFNFFTHNLSEPSVEPKVIICMLTVYQAN